PAQFVQFTSERGKNIGKARPGLVVGAGHLLRRAGGLNDQVDRPVVEMEPPSGEQRALGAHLSCRAPAPPPPVALRAARPPPGGARSPYGRRARDSPPAAW